jgi:hypothetical protein
MCTVLVSYGEGNQMAMQAINALSMIEGVQVEWNMNYVRKETGSYDPEFVEKILRSDKSEGERIKREDLWK